jgi:hypothetical protein
MDGAFLNQRLLARCVPELTGSLRKVAFVLAVLGAVLLIAAASW